MDKEFEANAKPTKRTPACILCHHAFYHHPTCPFYRATGDHKVHKDQKHSATSPTA